MVELVTTPDRVPHRLINIQNFTKQYGTVAAVDNVSFSVWEGEILGLIGPNGSGKTTLFECLGGVRPADRGVVLQNQHPLTAKQRSTLLFYMPDGIAPWPAQTVMWALDFMQGIFGGCSSLRNEVSLALDLRPLLGRRMGVLSKGQLKRVLLAIGLMMPQPLLIADEPFEGLDLRQTREIGLALRSHSAIHKRTILLSIHQISDAARVCDRFVLLSAGKMCGEGTLDQLSALAKSQGRTPAAADLEEVFLALT